ncbi:MAG: lytic transglycosylase domain-containing protein [Bdellovibrionota bacterium]
MKNVIILFSVVLAVFVLTPVAEAGPIYVYQQDGVIKFTTKTPPAGVAAKVFTAKSSNYSIFKNPTSNNSKLFTDRYRSIIQTEAQRYRLSPALIQAVIHAESAFNPMAVSRKGAKGLMQLMPSNLNIYGVNNPFSPSQNIKAGAELLAKLVRKYNGNIRLVLAAYNAGEGAVEKHQGVPPYTETRNYVPKVISLFHRYRAAA